MQGPDLRHLVFHEQAAQRPPVPHQNMHHLLARGMEIEQWGACPRLDCHRHRTLQELCYQPPVHALHALHVCYASHLWPFLNGYLVPHANVGTGSLLLRGPLSPASSCLLPSQVEVALLYLKGSCTLHSGVLGRGWQGFAWAREQRLAAGEGCHARWRMLLLAHEPPPRPAHHLRQSNSGVARLQPGQELQPAAVEPKDSPGRPWRGCLHQVLSPP